MQAYEVGGAVRDKLLGLPVVDRDWVVVGATPEEMVALGYTPVGRDFPVFLHPVTHEEHALARTERKSGRGYKGFTVYAAPDVTLEEDLARRDLTINAMALGPDGRIIDPFGGEADLRAGLLRHVGEAFHEDPVRILRVGRFAARFQFRVCDETMQLMTRMVDAGEVDHLIAERVWQEFERGLSEPHPKDMFLVLEKCGALAHLAPELQAILAGASRDAVFEALTRAVHEKCPPHVRFATLAWFAAADCEAGFHALCKRMRAPNDAHELAILVCRCRAEISGATQADAAGLLRLLKQSDAFRRTKRFDELLWAAQVAASSLVVDAGIGRARAALGAAAAIDGGAIAAATHAPAEIPAAIDAARLEAIRTALGK